MTTFRTYSTIFLFVSMNWLLGQFPIIQLLSLMEKMIVVVMFQHFPKLISNYSDEIDNCMVHDKITVPTHQKRAVLPKYYNTPYCKSSRFASSNLDISLSSPPQNSSTSCHNGFGNCIHCFNTNGLEHATG